MIQIESYSTPFGVAAMFVNNHRLCRWLLTFNPCRWLLTFNPFGIAAMFVNNPPASLRQAQGRCRWLL